MRHQPIRVQRERRYPISVEEAWRILADTDHLNRSIGLPAVQFSPLEGARDRLVLRGRTRAFGVVPVRWKEYPFDWIRERRYAVRREFEGGPVACLEGGVELVPANGDGVVVRSFAVFTPANLPGRVLWRVGKGPVSRILSFCDQYLARQQAGKADPVPVPSSPPHVDRGRLDGLLQLLSSAPVRPELVAKLRERILEGSDDQLVAIRPYALADVWGADRLEALRLFLHATRVGLFELRWELMCPNCRIPKAEARSLVELPNEFHCEVCGIAYAPDFDERVELRFSIHPAVRDAADTVYCIGGPLRMPHVVAQQYLCAHEDRIIDAAFDQPLRLRTVGATHQLHLIPIAGDGRTKDVRATYAAGRWTGPHSLTRGEAQSALIVPEGAAFHLRNQTDGPLLAVLEDIEWTGDATTAAQVTTLQEFRDLFGSELLAPGQQLAVRYVALLFSDLRGSTQLYEEIGDSSAYSRVNRHFDLIKGIVASRQGTIVKTLGDGVMCAFHRLDDALAAAITLQHEVIPWCREQGINPPLALKIGVHRGPVIAASANDRLDYFGRAVNVAARLGDESRGGDVVLLREVLDQAVALPAGVSSEPFRAWLRGVDSEQELVRLKP